METMLPNRREMLAAFLAAAARPADAAGDDTVAIRASAP